MLKNFRCVKKAWNELTEELLNEYIRSYDRVKIGAIAFEKACNKVKKFNSMLTTHIYFRFSQNVLLFRLIDSVCFYAFYHNA